MAEKDMKRDLIGFANIEVEEYSQKVTGSINPWLPEAAGREMPALPCGVIFAR
jgi:hypothetical protein